MSNNDNKSCASTSINWYPGHMAKTKKQIIKDLSQYSRNNKKQKENNSIK